MRKTFRDGTRIYEHNGEVFPSVTTILGNIDKPALIYWAAKQVAEFAYDNRPAWETLDRDAAVDLLKRSPYRSTNKAANLGSLIHEIAEARANGTQHPPVPPAATGKVAAFDQWVDDWQPTIIATELEVYNRAVGYAGTGDLWCNIDGTPTIVDIKTGKGVYPEVTLQTTAYANAEFTLIGGEEHEPPDAHLGFVLHLTDDGYQFRPLNINHPHAMPTIKALVDLHWWLQDHAEATLAKPLERNPR